MKIGEGKGIKGHYLGLPGSSTAKIVILPIPFDLTSTYRRGSKRGPEALIEASRNLELYDIETDSDPYLQGIITAPPIQAKTSRAMIAKAYKMTTIYLNEGRFVVALGGEHTISYGVIKAHKDYYPKLTVVHLDAHADLAESYENNPWSHASVMARVRELDVPMISIGVRSMSRKEKEKCDHPLFIAVTDKVETVLNAIQGPIYLTFDLDVFDSSLMPSTGTPEPGGLDWPTALRVLKIIAKNLVGFDIVELCPNRENPAPDYLAAKLLYKILAYRGLK
jgi:agmatinase